MKSPFSRRALLASGTLASIGAAWTSVSDSWSARFLRSRLAEFGQDVPPAPHTPAPDTWTDNAVTLAWLGHATVLVNFYGLRILTDPVLFPRIGVDLGIGSLGPLRLVQCALAPEALPEIDLVLVSHAHFDHLDTPSLAVVRGRPVAVMAAATADLLPRGVVTVTDSFQRSSRTDEYLRDGSRSDVAAAMTAAGLPRMAPSEGVSR